MNRSKYLRIFGYILLVIYVLSVIVFLFVAINITNAEKDTLTKAYTWIIFVIYVFVGPFTGILALTVADNSDDISLLQAEVAKLKRDAKKLDDTVHEIAPPKEPTTQPKAIKKTQKNTKIEVGCEVELTKTHYFQKHNLRMYKETKGTVVEISDDNKYLVQFNNGYIQVQDWVEADEIRAI